MSAPRLSVLLVTHGAWSWTRRALDAVRAHTTVEHEIIVVDNASPDGTPERIRELFPDVRVIVNDENAGFGAANNQAATSARGSVLALVNTDAIVPAGWDLPLLAALERDGVGAVVPALLSTDGTLQAAGGLAGPDGSVVNVGAGADADDPAHRFTRATDYGAAACMLLDREIFLGIGGFDHAYDPAYFEDVDLCLRLAGAGLRTLVVPEVRVQHEGFASGGVDAAVALFERNRPVFVGRWERVLARDHPPTLWPVHPARTLAARDACCSGRVLLAAPGMPEPQDAVGSAIAEALDVAPWIRLTLVTGGGAPDEWLRRGVEVVGTDDPPAVLAERAGHYDIVVADEGLKPAARAHQPQALWLGDPASLAPALERLDLR